MKVKSTEIIYPIFIELVQYTDDSYWIQILTDMAYGQCPYGIYLDNNQIKCMSKKKNINIILDAPSQELYEKIKATFIAVFNTTSNKESYARRLEFNEFIVGDSSVSKKGVQSIMIDFYVIKHSKGKSIKYMKRYSSLIHLMFSLKNIQSDDVVYNSKTGEIEHITMKPLKNNILNLKYT
jgi:hypothetical protein